MAFFNIFQRTPHYIGLHINTHAIKALQFNIARKETTVKAYTNMPTPKGMVVNDDFPNIEGLAEIINNSLDKPQHGRFSTDRVVVALPESKSFIRVIPLQAMTDDEIERAIIFEAEAYIPMPMDQVYYDWQILSRTDKQIDVLLIATPKEYVTKLITLVELAGLKISGIETEAQSVARALVPEDVTEPVLIADIDAFKTALIKVKKGALQFTSSIPLAGNVFTERLAKAASITIREAEAIKRKHGFANTVQYPNLRTQLLPAVEDLAQEISNILKFHYDHNTDHIEQLILTGGGAKLRHLAETLEPMLEEYAPIKVTVADPFAYVPNLKEKLLSPYEALSFTTTIGLAMWEIK